MNCNIKETPRLILLSALHGNPFYLLHCAWVSSQFYKSYKFISKFLHFKTHSFIVFSVTEALISSDDDTFAASPNGSQNHWEGEVTSFWLSHAAYK